MFNPTGITAPVGHPVNDPHATLIAPDEAIVALVVVCALAPFTAIRV